MEYIRIILYIVGAFALAMIIVKSVRREIARRKIWTPDLLRLECLYVLKRHHAEPELVLDIPWSEVVPNSMRFSEAMLAIAEYWYIYGNRMKHPNDRQKRTEAYVNALIVLNCLEMADIKKFLEDRVDKLIAALKQEPPSTFLGMRSVALVLAIGTQRSRNPVTTL